MTLIACPIFVDAAADVDHALARARTALAQGARIIEWRVDSLAEEPDATSAVTRLVDASPGPCIVTCRPEWEGGEYEGDEAARAGVLEAAAAAGARYVDVELAGRDRSDAIRAMLALSSGPDARSRADARDGGIILSSHDFHGRPASLLQRVEAMANEPACAVAKIVWTARSLRDNLEAFDLLAGRAQPMIALCMGPFGLMSRVLAPKFGAFLTFAASSVDAESAPGQPTIEDLRTLYRFDAITRQTRVYGVIGWPIEHSLSPAVHNAGFSAVDHDGVYLPMPIPPEYEHFKATVGSLIDHPRLGFAGASVTIPHKSNLLRFVAERDGHVDSGAARIGAANTLVVEAGGTIACTNTDCPAAVTALQAGLDREEIGGLRVGVLGAGGVARAVVAGLSEAGAGVTISSRTPKRAEELAASFDGPAPIRARAMEEMGQDQYDVIVNCTPVGMFGGPDPDGSPLPAGVEINERVTVFDTVYNPVRTPLLRDAESRGANIVTGIDMFLEQARRQFELWTQGEAPLDAMRGGVEP